MKSLFPRFLSLGLALFGGARLLPGDELPKPEPLAATVEYTLPPAAVVPDNSFTALWSGGGKIFVIWRDAKLQPWVAEVPDGGGEGSSVLLDPVGADNPRTTYVATTREPQYCYSLGLDKKGYIHVAGDMHGYPGSNDRFMLGRYKRRNIMYWKSKSPYTVRDGFVFVGGDDLKSMPGSKWTYGSFFADNDGELYFTAHVVAIGGKHIPAEGGIGLYRYDAEKETWSAIGAEPPHLYPDAQYYPVLLWDFPGSPAIAKESHGTIRFDKKNRMHFAAPASTGPEIVGLNALVYGCSDDGGKTWKKANGDAIAGLPLRASGPNAADIVAAYDYHGLLMRVYNTKEFTDKPAKVCLAPEVDLHIYQSAQSAHWTGELVAREQGEITLELTTNGDSFLNLIKLQKGILDFSTSMKNGDAWKMVLDKDQTIGLDIEWHKTKSSGNIALYWTTPGHRKEPVPAKYLLPGLTRFDLFASVCTDKDGNPAIACSPSNSLESGWRYWDAAAKRWSVNSQFPGVSRTFNKIYTGMDGGLTFESNYGLMKYSKQAYQYVVDPTILTRAEKFEGPMKCYKINYTELMSADEATYRKTGVYRAFAFDETLWHVVRIAFPPLQ